MAIGGLGGGLLAGLSGIAQGLAEAHKQREQQQLMQIRQRQLLDASRSDQASSALFGNILGGLGDVTGGSALTSPMMAGPQPPSPGQPWQAYSPAPAGSGMSSGLSNPLALIEQYESGGRNIPQGVVPPGGGYNPSVGRVTGPSSAGGYYQIIDPTWREYAPKAGVDTGQFPTALSAPREVQTAVAQVLYNEQGMKPWAPYNANLRAAIGRGESGGRAPDTVAPPDAASGGAGPGTVSETGIARPGVGAARPAQQGAAQQQPAMPRLMASAPPPVQQQVQQTAVATASAIPQQVWGRMSLPALAAQIEKANPGMDPVVKMMALEKAQKLLAPTELRQWEMFKQQHQDAIHLEDQKFARETALLAEDRGNRRLDRTETHAEMMLDKRLEGGSSKGFQFITKPDGSIVRANPNTGVVEPVDALQGASKMGTGSKGVVSPEARNLVAQGIADYSLPPLSSWALKSPEGMSTMAEVKKLNPKYDATQFTGKQSGARATGTRSANLTMAANVAEEIIPLVQQTSHAMDAYKTQFPNINSMILAVEKGTGDETVVRFLEQINTLKYVYARALNPTGVARVDDLRRFDDIINQAWTTGQIDAALDQIKQSLAAERRGVDKTLAPKTGAAAAGSEPDYSKMTDQELIDLAKKAQ